MSFSMPPRRRRRPCARRAWRSGTPGTRPRRSARRGTPRVAATTRPRPAHLSHGNPSRCSRSSDRRGLRTPLRRSHGIVGGVEIGLSPHGRVARDWRRGGRGDVLPRRRHRSRAAVRDPAQLVALSTARAVDGEVRGCRRRRELRRPPRVPRRRPRLRGLRGAVRGGLVAAEAPEDEGGDAEEEGEAAADDGHDELVEGPEQGHDVAFPPPRPSRVAARVADAVVEAEGRLGRRVEVRADRVVRVAAYQAWR